ncbi:MAG: SCO family protein [Anaerolineales bacterium]|nr:SCO family protein [Anaerolineales bacterium]
MTAETTSILQPDSAAAQRFHTEWLWALPIVIALGLAAFSILRPIQVLPRIMLAPGYALTDQNGELLTNEDMRGKIVLYNVTYTNCADPCVQTSLFMQQVQARLGELPPSSVPIELVTISIDPAHDTPEVLAAYAAELGATDRWHFVSGAANRLKAVVGAGFGLYYEPQPDGRFALDTGLMLVDGTGILRAEYVRKLPDMDIVLRDLNLLLEEAQNSEGMGRLAYEAAHLFSCYPR